MRTCPLPPPSQGIEAYAQKGDWARCLEVAQQQGPHMLVKYATLHGSALMQQSSWNMAAKVFATHGTATTKEMLGMYRRLAREIQ